MTDRPRVYVTRRHLAATEARLAADYDAAINEDDHIMSADELVAAADGMDALLICVTEPMDAALIDRLPDSVRAILTLSVGLDHIDTDAAKARGIAVLNTPDAVTAPTAEIGMLLLLGAARRAAEGEDPDAVVQGIVVQGACPRAPRSTAARALALWWLKS